LSRTSPTGRFKSRRYLSTCAQVKMPCRSPCLIRTPLPFAAGVQPAFAASRSHCGAVADRPPAPQVAVILPAVRRELAKYFVEQGTALNVDDVRAIGHSKDLIVELPKWLFSMLPANLQSTLVSARSLSQIFRFRNIGAVGPVAPRAAIAAFSSTIRPHIVPLLSPHGQLHFRLYVSSI
jgi:hypothetical protein